MINLKKLEEQLDKALAKETRKSLTNWLLKQRRQEKYSIEFIFDSPVEVIQDQFYILIIKPKPK